MSEKKTISSTFGKNIKVTVFGGSHEDKIGCLIHGLRGEAADFDHERLQAFLDLRAPGNSPFATKRKEPDKLEIRSTDPLTIIIRNTDQRSGDYERFRTVPRPGHADLTAAARYADSVSMAGGGPFSGRMTAPLCIAGGIALQALEKRGIKIGAHLLSVGDISDQKYDSLRPDLSRPEIMSVIYGRSNSKSSSTQGQCAKSGIGNKENNANDIASTKLPAIDSASAEKMAKAILAARSAGDSIGGMVEVAASGLPAGIGGAMYDGIESILAPIYFGIPAVKAVEFGAGKEAARMKGSQHNDPFAINDGKIVTTKNDAGGILGGITTGMPIIARIAFKPTPSIAMMQGSVNTKTMKEEQLEIGGRHDPCVAVRAVPVCIAATAIGLYDAILDRETK